MDWFFIGIIAAGVTLACGFYLVHNYPHDITPRLIAAWGAGTIMGIWFGRTTARRS